MKKILSIFVVMLIAIGGALLGSKIQANKNVFGEGSRDDLERAKQISLDVLRDTTARRAVGSVDDLKIEKVAIDELKMAHTRVRQTVEGIPVWEGEAIVHLKSDGSLATVTDGLKEAIAVSTAPNLPREEAIKIAMRMYAGAKYLTAEPVVDLWIFRGETRDHLVYRVQMRREDGTEETAMPVIFVDAQTGEKVFEYDNLQTASGASLYSGTVNISTSAAGSTYYMEDTIRKMGTFNMNNTGNTTTGTGGTQSRYTDTNDIWDATAQKAGVDAHYGAAATYDYYKNVHGRNGIDGNNGPGSTTAAANSAIALVPSRVHFGASYNNAFWNGNAMTYGDGDGSQFTPLVTLDIAGHEMTHGVTERTAGLTYSNESGALNESMSDVFGSMVESYSRGGAVNDDTWKIGEQAYTPATAGDALRSMKDTHSGGDPDHYSERYTGTADNGGVHTNSGIGNNVFYLAAAGGTNHVSGVAVTGMGTTDAGKIWYRALTVYMTSGTNYAAARTATLNAATDLFGSTSAQYTTTATAWCAAGIGACPTANPTPTPTPNATPTPGSGGSEFVVNGGFEGGTVSPWVLSSTGAFFNANSTYPHSGVGYINLGVNNSLTGTAYQTVTIPSTATGTMSFWLNVTSDETGTTQYDKLYVEVRNTAGTLLATLGTYSNVNKTTAGAYSQKSFSVAGYKGQTVRVQFRATMDSSVTTAFRIDDVSVK